MKIVSSILAMSLLLSNVGMANGLSAFNEEVFTSDEDTTSELSWEEEERIGPAAIIGIIIAAAAFGCDRAKDEGKALARRNPGAKKVYKDNRWKIRAGVLAGGVGGLVILRCFENGLMS
jgi:hypothetical protein